MAWPLHPPLLVARPLVNELFFLRLPLAASKKNRKKIIKKIGAHQYMHIAKSGGGGISFNTAGSISTSVMWKLSPGKLPFPRTWNNIEMDIF